MDVIDVDGDDGGGVVGNDISRGMGIGRFPRLRSRMSAACKVEGGRRLAGGGRVGNSAS
jgi:hypothetical protein